MIRLESYDYSYLGVLVWPEDTKPAMNGYPVYFSTSSGNTSLYLWDWGLHQAEAAFHYTSGPNFTLKNN